MVEKIFPETIDILIRLKRETETAHLTTEMNLPFGKPDFSIADYQNLLVSFYMFYRIFEPQIEAAIKSQKIDFDYRKRLKTPKLKADLQSLKINEKKISEINRNFDLPLLSSPEKIFGALYVVEGSTLGGQIISRQLKQQFGFGQDCGAGFFSGYGQETGKMWNEFRTAITKFAEAGANHDDIISAALETFEKFGQALERKRL